MGGAAWQAFGLTVSRLHPASRSHRWEAGTPSGFSSRRDPRAERLPVLSLSVLLSLRITAFESRGTYALNWTQSSLAAHEDGRPRPRDHHFTASVT